MDLRTGQADNDDPAHSNRWEQSRTIRAETLIDLVTAPDPVEEAGRPRALHLAGAKITGTLNLQAAERTCPITFRACWFEQFRPATPPGRGGARLSAAIYAMDVLLPMVNLNQETAWLPTGWICWWLWASILAGWVLTTAVVAALTGLLKRDGIRPAHSRSVCVAPA